jgi:hypothetical protein
MNTADQDHAEASRQAWLGRLDSLGVLLSGICIVHCLALPLLLVALPFLGGSFLGGHGFHEWLLLAVLPVSIVALGAGYRSHGDARVLWLGGAGLFLLAFATYGHPWFGLPEIWERGISIVGGVIHAGGHILNFRRSRALHAQCELPGHLH